MLTTLLQQARRGDREAQDKAFRLIEDEIRVRLKRLLKNSRPNPMIDTTGIIDDVYVRMMHGGQGSWQSRSDFLGHACVVLRNLLADLSRIRLAKKRGAGIEHFELKNDDLIHWNPTIDYLALHEALEELGKDDPIAVKVVELKFFGKEEYQSIADHLGITVRQAYEKWYVARARLRIALDESDERELDNC